MAGFKSDGDDDVMGDINVTPMVDVVLVLLIIFMVTSSVIQTTAHDIPIPTAANAEEKSAPPPLSIGFKKVTAPDGTSSGDLRLNDEPMTRAQLTERLRAEVDKNKKNPDPEQQKTVVLISASGEFAYQEVVDLIDLARGAGVSAVSLNTKVRPADLPSSAEERDAGSAYAP
jgi:biopolymer transport protein ExbD